MLSKKQRQRLIRFIPSDLIPPRGGRIESGGARKDYVLLLARLEGLDAISDYAAIKGGEALEEWSALVNNVLGWLLEEIEKYRGVVIWLSTDEILATFPGNSGAARLYAVSCARDLITAAENISPLKGGFGEKKFAVKVAVHAGKVNDLGVGSEKRIYRLLAGKPVVELSALAENAQPSMIVLSPSATEGVENKLKLKGDKEVAELLEIIEPVQPEGRKSLPEDIGNGLELLLPAGIPDKLIAVPGDAEIPWEHRYATVLSLTFTYLADTFQAYNQYLEAVDRIVGKFGGMVECIGLAPGGYHMRVVFGVPVAREESEKSASLAAREIVAVPGAGIQKIGIGSGYILAGVAGSDTRKGFLVAGSAVNESRMQMKAASNGEIRVGEGVRKQVETMFVISEKDPVSAAGKPGKRASGALGDRKVAVDWLAPPQGKLVGRKEEIKELTGFLSKVAQTKRGILVTLVGDAGVGKTRLVQEFARLAAKSAFTVTGGSCASYGKEIPYLPWSQAFTAFLAEGEERVGRAALERAFDSIERPTWAPLLAPYVGVEVEENDFTRSLRPAGRKQKLFALALELITHNAEQNPLLLIFDNLQWVDSLSRDLIATLVDLLPDIPVLLVTVTRPTGDPLPWQQTSANNELRLSPLSQSETSDLIANYLKVKEVDKALLDVITRSTQGNPFFTEEYLRLMVTSKVIAQDGSQVKLKGAADLSRLPPTIHRVIWARIDLLDERAKSILRTAAIIGQRFEYDVLNQVQDTANGEALKRQLSLLEYYGLVTKSGTRNGLTYDFNNVLTREVAYDSVPFSQRRACHEKVAKLLEERGGEQEQVLLQHYAQTSDEEKTLEYLMESAAHAARAYANEEAIGFYTQALEKLADHKGPEALSHRFDILRRRERLFARIGGRKAQQKDLKALLALAVSLQEEKYVGIVLSRESAFRFSVGDMDNALTKGLKAVKLLRDSEDKRELFRAERNVVRSLESLGRFTEAGDYLTRMRSLAQEIDDNDMMASVNTDFAGLCQQQGDYRGSLDFYKKALALYEKGGDEEGKARTAGQMGVAYKYLGLLKQARKAYHSSLEAAVKTGDRKKEEATLRNLAIITKNSGKYEEALEYCEKALKIARAIHDRGGEAGTLDTIGNIKRAQGYYNEAIKNLNQAVKIVEKTKERPREVRHLSNLANVYLELGDYDKALDYINRSLAMAEELGARKSQALGLLITSLIKRRRGEFAEGLELVRKAAVMLYADGAEVLHIDALVEEAYFHLAAQDYAKAEETAHKVMEAARAKGLHSFEAASLRIQAEVLLAQKDKHGAFFLSSRGLKMLKQIKREDIHSELTHFKILSSLGKKKEAFAIVDKLHSKLADRAEKIADPGLRKSFLENVEENRLVMEVWEELRPEK